MRVLRIPRYGSSVGILWYTSFPLILIGAVPPQIIENTENTEITGITGITEIE